LEKEKSDRRKEMKPGRSLIDHPIIRPRNKRDGKK